MPKNLWIRFIFFLVLPSILAGFSWGWPWFLYSVIIICLVASEFRGNFAPISAIIAALLGGLALGHWNFIYSIIYWIICAFIVYLGRYPTFRTLTGG